MSDGLTALRRRIDALDDQLLALLTERLAVAREMGDMKRRAGAVRRDPDREDAIVARLSAGDVPPEIVAAVWQALFTASRRVQGCED